GILVSPALARCLYADMRDATDQYTESQASGQLGDYFTAPGVKYLENGMAVNITKAILHRPLNITYSRTMIDQENCVSYTELVAEDLKDPYVIGTQVHLQAPSGEPGTRIYLVDSVITTTKDYRFNATQTSYYLNAQDWSYISTEDQYSRDTLKAIADAYLDQWSNGTKTAVQWAATCARLEGGSYVSNPCGAEVNGTQPSTHRRYVIDVTIGSVNVQSTFGPLGNAPASHDFRVVSGKLLYVN
ncbi:hypothetical protein GQ53DRAFT_612257, partial [Thozetella sp. PMI_491]